MSSIADQLVTYRSALAEATERVLRERMENLN